MTAIVDIIGREILDSRGNPTVEVDVVLEDGSRGRAGVPSGASTGAHEAVELRDGDKKRYLGKGVRTPSSGQRRDLRGAPRHGCRGAGQDRRDHDRARRHAEQRPARRQCDPRRLARRRKGGGGANKLPLYRYVGGTSARFLPVPMMNIVNGGVHADNQIDFQEFMIMPVGVASLSEALRAGSEIFHTLRSALKADGHNTKVGDEGGFAPDLPSAEAALDFVSRPSKRPATGSATTWRSRSIRRRASSSRTALTLRRRGQDALDRPAGRVSRRADQGYPIVSIEDGMAEDDYDGWKKLTQKIGNAASWSATIFSSPMWRGSQTASRTASAIRS